MFLGNLSIIDLERRTRWTFSESDRKWLESHRQDVADIDFDSDKFHIFDLPFEIYVSYKISDYLVKLLTKYEEIQPSKEQLQIAVIKETDKQRESLEKERKEKEWQDTLHNPNAVWNIKWDMLVPVTIVDAETGREYECYYGCFINTYTAGRNNIPDTISGVANIYLNEDGLHGNFKLNNPEKDSDADSHLDDWAFVIGMGFYKKDGSYVGKVNNVTFEKVQFSI